jgi:predicted dehydrogenase
MKHSIDFTDAERTDFLTEKREKQSSYAPNVPLGIAFIGCGFVADFYNNTLKHHKNIQLIGVYDKDKARTDHFTQYFKTFGYDSYEAVLADTRVDIVVNLTNPDNHYEVTKAALLAGKHVYSEKPFAMRQDHAQDMVNLAKERNLMLSAAPCSMLGETAQTIWKALREEVIGKVLLVYAEMDDGMIHQDNYKRWASDSGTLWPYLDEFHVGCTVEHAGYYLAWLPVFFGPAASITAWSDCLIPNKMEDEATPQSADFSTACIRFASGVVARLTCGIVAPHDRSLRIVGDKGILEIKDCWDYDAPVYLRRWIKIMGKRIEHPLKKRIKPVRSLRVRYAKKASHQMDFSRGIAEMAAALIENRPCRLSADLCLHINELTFAMQNAGNNGICHEVKTTFEQPLPMEWAK